MGAARIASRNCSAARRLPPAVGALPPGAATAAHCCPLLRRPNPASLPAGAQLVSCADAGSAAYDESELVREVEAAAAMVGAAAEPAIPIAPASPTFTPYVPIEAAVICMDGVAPAIKLNKANCVARYTPVYNAVRCGGARLPAARATKVGRPMACCRGATQQP